MTRLKRIAITPEDIHPDEPAIITEILKHGWDMVHLRHPQASLRDMRNLVEAIPQKFHSQLRLHGHFELTNSFNLGGIHLNSRCPSIPTNYNGPASRSCHSLEEVLLHSGTCDYVTLSPIFDSVSKTGYKSCFSEHDLTRFDNLVKTYAITNVIALGGVVPENIPLLSRYPFAGYAVLGYLMKASGIEDLKERLRHFDETTI